MHKGHITATVRLSTPGSGGPSRETRTFSALASGLTALVRWLIGHHIGAAAMEATGVYMAPAVAGADRLSASGRSCCTRRTSCNRVAARPTSRTATGWRGCVSSSWDGRASFPPSSSTLLRSLSRHRRKLVTRRRQVAAEVHGIEHGIMI